MAAGVQDFNRTEFDRLNEIKGHLEIALLEKHFLREYQLGTEGRRDAVLRSAASVGAGGRRTAVAGLVGRGAAPCACGGRDCCRKEEGHSGDLTGSGVLGFQRSAQNLPQLLEGVRFYVLSVEFSLRMEGGGPLLLAAHMDTWAIGTIPCCQRSGPRGSESGGGHSGRSCGSLQR